MPPTEPCRVFISYAHGDGAKLAQCLQKDLNEKGFDTWLDKQRLAGGASWTKDIETALDEAEYVLALMTTGSYVSEICRAEQLRALRKKKCVIPLLAQDGTEIPLHLETKEYRDFRTNESYRTAFSELLDDIHRKRGITLDDTRDVVIDEKTGAIRKATDEEIRDGKKTHKEEFRQKFRETNYVTVPPLPVNFVDRPEELAALRDALFTDEGGRHIALTALEGMGGIGKTVLAQALCHDEVVQQAFPDGVIWITIGKESMFDVVTRMREVGKALGDDLSRYENELGAKNQYRSTIANKAALIVADDVWDATALDPLRAESSPRSRLLFTTRDKSITAAVGAYEHIVDLLTYKQSRDVLALWSRTESEKLPPLADDLIRECGRLPLALSMVGAMLRSKPLAMWNRVRDLLDNADLGKITAHFPDYPYPSLLAALQVSVDELDATTRERYLALAVLLEDMPIAPAIQQCLWKVVESEAAETAGYILDLSLAQSGGVDGSFRLHDLQLDYVRAQYSDKEALELIHAAVRYSSEVIAEDPSQFAPQVTGGLLSVQVQPGVQQFLDKLSKSVPYSWLRPLWPALRAPECESVRRLKGHPKWADSVALSGNGRLAVSASDDQTLKVWEVESGREMRTLQGHSGRVFGVALSGDGRLAVSASKDQTLKVWEVESGRELRTLRGHSDRIRGVALSGDGRLAVSASDDQTLKVWEVESGRELRTLEGHLDSVNGVALSGDGRLAVSAADDRTLKVWELESGRELRTLEGHTSAVTGVTVSGDGRLVISASWDKMLKVWEVESGRELRTLEGHTSAVTGVAVSGDGRLVISASWDKMLKVSEVESGRELRTLQGHAAFVNGVALSGDGRLAVSAYGDTTLKVWEVESGRELRTQIGRAHV